MLHFKYNENIYLKFNSIWLNKIFKICLFSLKFEIIKNKNYLKKKTVLHFYWNISYSFKKMYALRGNVFSG